MFYLPCLYFYNSLSIRLELFLTWCANQGGLLARHLVIMGPSSFKLTSSRLYSTKQCLKKIKSVNSAIVIFRVVRPDRVCTLCTWLYANPSVSLVVTEYLQRDLQRSSNLLARILTQVLDRFLSKNSSWQVTCPEDLWRYSVTRPKNSASSHMYIV